MGGFYAILKLKIIKQDFLLCQCMLNFPKTTHRFLDPRTMTFRNLVLGPAL